MAMRTSLFAGLIVSVALAAKFATVTAAVTLAATTALIMGGSGLGNPVATTDAGITIPIPNYLPNVEKYYIAPNSTCQPSTCRLVPVVTPEGLFPPIVGPITYDQSVNEGVVDLREALQAQLTSHPDDQVVVFGYSQSGDLITRTLRNFAKDPVHAPSTSQVSFVVAGNTNRPNGGILSRFPGLYIPGLNITFDGPAPTNTGYKTTDIAFEYDPVADFPQYPINLLADLNSLAGALGVHATYPNPYLPIPPGIPFFPTALPNGYTPAQLQQAMTDPANRQTYGDTTYITIPTKNLPLLQPLLDIGTDTHTSFLIRPAVDLIQPVLRVLVDLGYDRTTPYGKATPAALFPHLQPAKVGGDLAVALGQGLHQALTDLGLPTRAPATAVTTTHTTSASAKTAAAPATGTSSASNPSTAITSTGAEAVDTATSTTSARHTNRLHNPSSADTADAPAVVTAESADPPHSRLAPVAATPRNTGGTNDANRVRRTSTSKHQEPTTVSTTAREDSETATHTKPRSDRDSDADRTNESAEHEVGTARQNGR